MNQIYEVKQCCECGRLIYPRFRKAISNTSNTTDVYEVYYPECVCRDIKLYYDKKNNWTTSV